MRTFCFPYAGGGAAAFRKWPFCARKEITPIQYPGREELFHIPVIETMPLLVDFLFEKWADQWIPPFSLLGHSMGGLVCFSVTLRLLQMQRPLPERLIISATRPPHIPPRKKLHLLETKAFKEELLRYGQIPRDLLDHSEFAEVFLPNMRADFRLCETHNLPADPLPCPITVLGGSEDPFVSREELERWRDLTTGHSNLLLFPGDHFFLFKHAIDYVFHSHY